MRLSEVRKEFVLSDVGDVVAMPALYTLGQLAYAERVVRQRLQVARNPLIVARVGRADMDVYAEQLNTLHAELVRRGVEVDT